MDVLFLACFLCYIYIANKQTAASMELEAKITSSPLIYNAYLNSEMHARFICVTKNSDNIRWKVNGESNIEFYVHSIRQIDSRIILEQDQSFTSELTIPAIPVNQHIEVIKCEAYQTSGGLRVAESNETAQYHIQGLLEMKPNITYSSYNATHNQFQWLEPFTLNLTNITNNIENYTVCSHLLLLNNEHALGCTNLSVPQIYLPKYSANLSLLITAWNIVGESNNSATLNVEACVSNNIQNGDRFDLKIEFSEGGTTLLYITFKHLEENNILIEKCLSVYEADIRHNILAEATTTTHLFGYDQLVLRTNKLLRNTTYTISLNQITSNRNISLHSLNFSTYDLQGVTINRTGDIVYIICYFARGATIKSCIVQLRKEEQILLQYVLSIEQCEEMLCYTNGSIDISTTPEDGNLLLFILDQSSPENNVYFFDVTNLGAISTTDAIFTINVTTQMEATQQILVFIVGGGALGAVCLICLSFIILGTFWKFYKRRGQTKYKINEAYSAAPVKKLELKENEAYETTGSRLTPAPGVNMEQHMYEEIQSGHTHTKESLYDIIAGVKEPAYDVIGK